MDKTARAESAHLLRRPAELKQLLAILVAAHALAKSIVAGLDPQLTQRICDEDAGAAGRRL